MDDQALVPWRPPKRRRGQCSSSFVTMDVDYDVFLNHRGPDVKAGFIAHLDEALRGAGLNPFLDKESLRKGDPAFTSIDAALKVAKVHVAVVSKRYAESKYCLSELVDMLRSGKPVIPVYYEVEPAQLRWVENGPFAAAFEKHKRKRPPEQVHEWTLALRRLADITGFCFRSSDYLGDEAHLKREVVNAVLSKVNPTFEAIQVDHLMVGIKTHMNTCVKKLEKMSASTCLLGLVGMGGVGKTSLAKLIYNHFGGQRKFQAMSFLAINRNTVSSMEVGPSLLTGLQKQLLRDLLHVPSNNEQSYSYWYHKLSKKGPMLIVLDDIHEESQFDELILDTSLLAQGSCIIATSRDQHLLKIIGGESNFYIHEVTPLGIDDSQKLFNLHVFRNEDAPQNFKAIAQKVSNACGGMPLALKVVGSSLHDKRSSEDLECIWPEAVAALKKDLTIERVLKWSYNRLSEEEKVMFLDIAVEFYDRKKDEAMEIWRSCKDCLSCCRIETPNITLRKLIDKSLVVIDNSQGFNVLTMHGLLQDMGRSIGISNGSHLWGDKATKALEDGYKGHNKVRVLNLANSRMRKFKYDDFEKITNLHYLILDGCDVSGNVGCVSKELRWLQWKNMPLTHIPSMLDFSNLVSLDFSYSTYLANAWVESNPALEACPNLLRLNLERCTSITTLPHSIGRLSKLQILDLFYCMNLQELPSSIGQLTGLVKLNLMGCENLKALPDSISTLPELDELYISGCSSMSRMPSSPMTTLGMMFMEIDEEWQALALGQLIGLRFLNLSHCSDEGNALLDSSGAFGNLHQLFFCVIFRNPGMTKLPQTMGLLTNLGWLELCECEGVRELPESMGHLKLLTRLRLIHCDSLETLPDCLGALTRLRHLWIQQCPSLTKLPESIGLLSSLRDFRIAGCAGLQPLPDSIRQLNALERLDILDCGSLVGLGVSTVLSDVRIFGRRVLPGLRIWGCTSVTELPGSCLMVVDSNFSDPMWFGHHDNDQPVPENLKELRLVEENDCGFLRHVHDTPTGRFIVQRVHEVPCCKSAL
ncbi:hypothetical protein KC19_2G074800 [Ceratodon purpureus]|uniref:TIR domain-containing protein n=1 Tax=Ceratodon purpureus TaxID=3225 RepID=A0A8T0IU22_CERPU|nr:hypothetical protein KC19_2G074800 [Ceratodon purpureus]